MVDIKLIYDLAFIALDRLTALCDDDHVSPEVRELSQSLIRPTCNLLGRLEGYQKAGAHHLALPLPSRN